MSPQPQAVEIFYSYSHKDEGLRLELESHLSLLKRQGIIRAWHDRKLGAGDEWAQEIDEHLNTAHVILLLISADFLASDYCYDVELRRAMERHAAADDPACVIPIILRPCDWLGASFGKLQALPLDAKPVTRWADRDEAWLNVSAGIRAAVKRLLPPDDARTPVAPARPRPLSGQGSAKPFEFSSQPSIPPLLPYLCDRSDQEHVLGVALRRQQQAQARRPFLLFIHGDELECHGEFLARMQVNFIPRILNLEARQHSIKEYALQWPSAGVPRRDYQQVWQQNLGEILLQDSNATPAQINEFITQHEEPLLITSHLLTESFDAGGIDLPTAYLEFWRTWPDLPPGRIVLAAVCLKHQRSFEHTGLLRRWRLKRLSTALRAFITALDFSTQTTLPGVVLPELEAIRRGHVEDWLRQHAREHAVIQERDIRALYARPDLCTPDGHIAMELLADELKTLLQKNHR
ncbi:MAG: TIR domain-containing protein [Pyrinomonadaceae bacterium]